MTYKSPSRGKFTAQVDDLPPVTIDCYDERYDVAFQMVDRIARDLDPAVEHTLTITVLEDGKYIDMDALDVYNENNNGSYVYGDENWKDKLTEYNRRSQRANPLLSQWGSDPEAKRRSP